VTKNIYIDENLENYISKNSYDLHPIQKEIIEHNNSLGDIKKDANFSDSSIFHAIINQNK